MTPQSYETLSDLELCGLCVWREARGEGLLGKRGVAHVIKNREDNPGWWGHDIHSVILCKYQFSSFNPGDPNEDKWPLDDDPSWIDSMNIAQDVLVNGDEDITGGAVNYYDISIPTPIWAESMTLTLAVGRLRFYKQQENTAT